MWDSSAPQRRGFVIPENDAVEWRGTDARRLCQAIPRAASSAFVCAATYRETSVIGVQTAWSTPRTISCDSIVSPSSEIALVGAA